MIGPKKWAVRVCDVSEKQLVIGYIKNRDKNAKLNREGNPNIFWITTVLDLENLKDHCPYPFDAVISMDN